MKRKTTTFEAEFAQEIWSTTYRNYKDITVDDTFMRVAAGIAAAETTPELVALWTDRFYDMMTDFKVTTGGRIYSNAGTEWTGTTLMNCFVAPRSKYDIDSLVNIIESTSKQSQTLKSEGGWGENFSYIRPRGAFIHGVGVETPGAIKYMELFDKSSEIVTSGSGLKSKNKKAKEKIRKGAMMGVIDCISGTSLIDTIDGKFQIKDMVGKKPYLYCTDGDGNVFVRQANKVWSKGIKKTIRVTFNNYDFIECTPDHEFMLIDGSYKKAKDLKMSDSLAALNNSQNYKVLMVGESIEQEVFDISMPAPNHNFSVNGVFIHNCWHPDVIEFITAKQTAGRLSKFNMSVNCSDEFMEKVLKVRRLKKENAPAADIAIADTWNLRFPDTTHERYKHEWSGDLKVWEANGYDVNVYDTTTVSKLWDLIMESTYNRAEPGVLFLDRANYYNPLNYAETIFATNPCLTGSTKITVRVDGSEQIMDMLSFNTLVNSGNYKSVMVKSMNTATSEVEFKEVTMSMLTSHSADIVRVSDDESGQFIECTPDHKIWTNNRGYVMAKNLKPSDELNLSK